MNTLYDFPETLAFIPARGGSKGLVDKNIKLLNGRPLIDYTLKLCDEINISSFISTDSVKIKEVCHKLGYYFEYLRPPELANDHSSIIDSVFDAIEWLDKKKSPPIKNILLLQPTSPLREKRDIMNALNMFNEKNMRSMFSVTPMREHPFECISIRNKSNMWDYLIKHEKIYSGRQDYKNIHYFIDGSFYLSTIDTLKEERSFLSKNYSIPFIINKRYSIDIDNIEDFQVVEKIIERGL